MRFYIITAILMCIALLGIVTLHFEKDAEAKQYNVLRATQSDSNELEDEFAVEDELEIKSDVAQGVNPQQGRSDRDKKKLEREKQKKKRDADKKRLHEEAVKRRQTFWSSVAGVAHTVLFGTLYSPFYLIGWLFAFFKYALEFSLALCVLFAIIVSIWIIKWALRL